SSGHLAFRASFEPGTGGAAGFFLNTANGTSPLVVLGESDADGQGGRLTTLNPGASLNSSDQIAFVGSSNQGKTRNGIFLASQSTMTAQALAIHTSLSTLLGNKPHDSLRGRVTLKTSGLADGFDLSKDAVTIAVADTSSTYVSATLTPNKLAKQGGGAVLKRRQSNLQKLALRVKRKTVRVSFAAAGLDP